MNEQFCPKHKQILDNYNAKLYGTYIHTYIYIHMYINITILYNILNKLKSFYFPN